MLGFEADKAGLISDILKLQSTQLSLCTGVCVDVHFRTSQYSPQLLEMIMKKWRGWKCTEKKKK